MTFSKKLRELRQQAGWSQEQLAERLGVTRQAVAKWESGAGFPDIDNIQQLAKLFHVSTDELLDYQKGGTLAAVIEPINLDDYPSDVKGRTQFDLAILDKCADCDHIEAIYRTPRLTWYQHIFDFFIGKGTLEIARAGDSVKAVRGDHALYLVTKSGRQWIVEINHQNLIRRELTRPFTGKSLPLGEYTYRRNKGDSTVLKQR